MASDGDIRVLLALDLVLSVGFTAIVLWGMEFGGLAELTPRNLAIGTAFVAVVTYLAVLRQ